LYLTNRYSDTVFFTPCRRYVTLPYFHKVKYGVEQTQQSAKNSLKFRTDIASLVFTDECYDKITQTPKTKYYFS